MGQTIIAVVGALLGTALGIVGTYLAQQRHFERESDERLAALRREAYVDWLGCLAALHGGIREPLRRRRAGDLNREELAAMLRDQPVASAQNALEHVRLLATDKVAEAAADLWRHMRREAVPLGGETSRAAWDTWNNQYWTYRRALIDAARVELGVAPLDWSRAGVDPIYGVDRPRAARPPGQ